MKNRTVGISLRVLVSSTLVFGAIAAPAVAEIALAEDEVVFASTRQVDVKDISVFSIGVSGKAVAGTVPNIFISINTRLDYDTPVPVLGQDCEIDHYESADGVDLGSSAPTEPGTYYVVIKTVEGSDYHGEKRVSFQTYAANDLQICTLIGPTTSIPLVDGSFDPGITLIAPDGTALREGVDYNLKWSEASHIVGHGYYSFYAEAIEGSDWVGSVGYEYVIHVYDPSDFSEETVLYVSGSA